MGESRRRDVQEPDEAQDRGSEALSVHPYSMRSFVRELLTALVVLAVGLPTVALIAHRAAGSSPVPSAATPVDAGTASPSASAGAVLRPVVVVTGPGSARATDAEQVLEDAVPGSSLRFVPSASFAGDQTELGQALATLPTDLAGVAVQAGERDADTPAGDVERGAEALVQRLRARVSPSTSITVIGPIPDGPPAPGLLRVRDELRLAARKTQVHFVDPVGMGWQQTSPDLGRQIADVLVLYASPGQDGASPSPS